MTDRDVAWATLMATIQNLEVNLRILSINEQILDANRRNAGLFAEILETLKSMKEEK